MAKQHLLDSGDLLRIAKHVLWPEDSLEHQVDFIKAAWILEEAEWGRFQPFQLWNSVPWPLRNTVFALFGEMLSITRTICEGWTMAAFELETALGITHPGTKGLKPTPKYSLPFLHNPMDDIDLNRPGQGAVEDSSVLGSIDGALRAVYSTVSGRYL
jgi:hypothetical protein